MALRFEAIDPYLAPGQQFLLRVLAELRDGSSEEVTSRAIWSSSQPSVATVTNGTANQSAGALSAVASGRTEIVATYQGLTATLTVTVGSNLLRSVEVAFPDALAIGIGGQFRFVAIAHYTDRSQFDDQSLTWTSSDPDLLEVSNQPGLRGTVTGIRPGTATVLATKDGVTWSTPVTVLNIRRLVGQSYGSTDPGPNPQAMVRIDGSGRSLALFGYVPIGPARPAAAIAVRPLGEGPWSTPASLGAAAQEVFAASHHLAMNEAGQAIVGWLGGSHLHVAHYSPTAGIGSTRLLSDAVSQGGRLPALTLAADGSGMFAWERLAPDFKPEIVYSRFNAIADRWTAPAQVPCTELTRGSAELLQMVANDAGQAAVLWRRRAPVTPNPDPGDAAINALMVSRFDPTAGAGWQPPDLLLSGDDPSHTADVDLAIGGAGHIVAAWVRSTGSTAAGDRVAHVRSRRFVPGAGWSDAFDVVSASPLSPAGPRLAINDAGMTVLGWRTDSDNGIAAAMASSNGTWDAPRKLFTPDLSFNSGMSQLLRPSIGSDGRALVAWRIDVEGLRSNLATCRYSPQTGWQIAATVPFVGSNFTASDIDLHFNRSGQGTAIWAEGTGEGSSLYTSTEFRL